MGCYNVTGDKRNIKVYDFIMECCSSWGYDERVTQVKDLLIPSLKQEGIKVNFTYVPLKNQNGEFFIYLKNELNEKIILMSNNKDLHAKEGAFIAQGISQRNINELTSSIKSKIIK